MLDIKRITVSILFSFGLLASNLASAAIVQFSVDGEITRATTDNYFNLAVGEIVTLTGQFDDSPLGAGVTSVDFSLSSNIFSLQFGNTTYTDADDVDNLALIYFYDSVFDGLDFLSSDGKFDSNGYAGGFTDPDTGIFHNDFVGHNDTVGGNWLADSYTVSAVPVPAAVWLFGSGLMLLGGFARKQQAKL